MDRPSPRQSCGTSLY